MATLNYSKCTVTDTQIADRKAHRKTDTDVATKKLLGPQPPPPPRQGGNMFLEGGPLACHLGPPQPAGMDPGPFHPLGTNSAPRDSGS